MGPSLMAIEMSGRRRLLSAVLMTSAALILWCPSSLADPFPDSIQATGDWLAQPEVEESSPDSSAQSAPAEEPATEEGGEVADPVESAETAAVFGRHTGTMYRPRGVWRQSETAAQEVPPTAAEAVDASMFASGTGPVDRLGGVQEQAEPVPEEVPPATEPADASVFGRRTGTMYRPRGSWTPAESPATTD